MNHKIDKEPRPVRMYDAGILAILTGNKVRTSQYVVNEIHQEPEFFGDNKDELWDNSMFWGFENEDGSRQTLLNWICHREKQISSLFVQEDFAWQNGKLVYRVGHESPDDVDWTYACRMGIEEARLILDVQKMFLQRLYSMTPLDCMLEGVRPHVRVTDLDGDPVWSMKPDGKRFHSPTEAFRAYYEQAMEDDWNKDPWIEVIMFSVRAKERKQHDIHS